MHPDEPSDPTEYWTADRVATLSAHVERLRGEFDVLTRMLDRTGTQAPAAEGPRPAATRNVSRAPGH